MVLVVELYLPKIILDDSPISISFPPNVAQLYVLLVSFNVLQTIKELSVTVGELPFTVSFPLIYDKSNPFERPNIVLLFMRVMDAIFKESVISSPIFKTGDVIFIFSPLIM